jgi:hypothetical protein
MELWCCESCERRKSRWPATSTPVGVDSVPRNASMRLRATPLYAIRLLTAFGNNCVVCRVCELGLKPQPGRRSSSCPVALQRRQEGGLSAHTTFKCIKPSVTCLVISLRSLQSMELHCTRRRASSSTHVTLCGVGSSHLFPTPPRKIRFVCVEIVSVLGGSCKFFWRFARAPPKHTADRCTSFSSVFGNAAPRKGQSASDFYSPAGAAP